MTKTYTFTNNSNKINTFNPFRKKTDYSKILDDIITADIIKKNDYLYSKNEDADLFKSLIGDKSIIFTSSNLKDDDDFIKATNFLANYKKNKYYTKIPYILGKMYTLSDGTPIVFYDDEIQIGFDTYKYNSFSNINFVNTLSNNTKKIIINIYTTGNTNININL